MNKQFNPNEYDETLKLEIFLKSLSWVSIVVYGTVLYFTILGLIQHFYVVSIMNNFITGFSSLSKNTEMSAMQSKVILYTRIGFSIVILFSSLMLLAAVGLLKYKEWGRILYLVGNWIVAVLVIGLSVFFIFFQGSLIGAANSISSFFKAETGFQTLLYIQYAGYAIFTLLLVWALVKINLKLKEITFKYEE